jgi:hypothetical protein
VGCIPAIRTLRRLRQEHHEFKASLGYIARHYLNKREKSFLEEIHI